MAWYPPSTWTISPVIPRDEVRQQEHDRVGDRRRVGRVPPERRPVAPAVGERLEPRDPLAGDRPQGAGGQGVDADPVRSEVAREVPRDRLERGLGHAHPVVDRPRDPGVEIERDDRAPVLLHVGEHPRRDRLQREGARLDRGRDALPRGVQEVPAERVLRRERDRVQEPVEPSPPGPDLGRDRLDVRGIVRVHLQDVDGIGEPARRLLRQPHRAPERGQDDLGPLLLQGLRGRVRDRLARQHAGDEQLLAFEQHRDPLGRPACY